MGDTYPIRSQLRDAGCSWDRDRKAWWTGKAALAAELAGGEISAPAINTFSKCPTTGGWLVKVPAGGTRPAPGRAVTVTKASGGTKEVTLAAVEDHSEGGWVCSIQTAKRNPRQDLSFVGVAGEHQSSFTGTKSNRAPQYKAIGEASWLLDGGQRVAVIVVGYDPARYVTSDHMEDFMGIYNEPSGYYGTLHYRSASLSEYQALQATNPRTDAVAPGM